MWKNREEYIEQDSSGRWVNMEFPPDSLTQYPYNNGYKNANSGMLFYDYAVQYYDLRISYHGKGYFAYVDDDGAFITDATGNIVGDIYPTANDLIKAFVFPDGTPILDCVSDAKRISIDIR